MKAILGRSQPDFGRAFAISGIDSTGMVAANHPEGLRNLAIGEGVYLLKVQATDSSVVLDVQACGACHPGSPEPNPVGATVTFPFRKGVLENMPLEQVLGAIAEVFARANPNPNTKAPPQVPAPAIEAAPPVKPATVPAAEPPREPARIELGQTLEQVQAILGRPDKVVDLGARKIFVPGPENNFSGRAGLRRPIEYGVGTTSRPIAITLESLYEYPSNFRSHPIRKARDGNGCAAARNHLDPIRAA